MKWALSQPVLGDMVRVLAGNIYHYGIFVSEDEVIQFGRNPALWQSGASDVQVLATTVDEFLAGGFLEVAVLDRKEAKKRVSPPKTVEAARKRLGEKGYHILYNNCEHFATQCLWGRASCSQTDEVRSFFRSQPVVDVYVAPVFQGEIQPVFPKERQAEIEACTNLSVRRQKYSAWRLLAYALEHTFGYQISRLKFNKTQSGKWLCKECYFSLTHTEHAVAVAVSRKPVGVDLELIQAPKIQGLERKILTPSEAAAYALTAEEEKVRFLLTAWTRKESLFKQSDEPAFRPSQTESVDGVDTQSVLVSGREYLLSVAAEDRSRLHVKEVRW